MIDNNLIIMNYSSLLQREESTNEYIVICKYLHFHVKHDIKNKYEKWDVK